MKDHCLSWGHHFKNKCTTFSKEYYPVSCQHNLENNCNSTSHLKNCPHPNLRRRERAHFWSRLETKPKTSDIRSETQAPHQC